MYKLQGVVGDVDEYYSKLNIFCEQNTNGIRICSEITKQQQKHWVCNT